MIILEQIKQHLKVEHDDEDDYLLLLNNAALLHAEQYLNRKLYVDAVSEDESNGLVMTDDIKAALLLMVGQWYEHRTETSDRMAYALPLSSKSLLNPYRLINL